MRNAIEQLADIRGGLMMEEMTEALAEVVNAVIATGKKGALQLKLDINPASKGDAVVTVADDIKKTVPQEKRTGTLMFATPSGSLQRQDPRQGDLPLMSAPTTAPALQAAPAESPSLRVVGGN